MKSSKESMCINIFMVLQVCEHFLVSEKELGLRECFVSVMIWCPNVT